MDALTNITCSSDEIGMDTMARYDYGLLFEGAIREIRAIRDREKFSSWYQDEQYDGQTNFDIVDLGGEESASRKFALEQCRETLENLLVHVVLENYVLTGREVAIGEFDLSGSKLRFYRYADFDDWTRLKPSKSPCFMLVKEGDTTKFLIFSGETSSFFLTPPTLDGLQTKLNASCFNTVRLSGPLSQREPISGNNVEIEPNTRIPVLPYCDFFAAEFGDEAFQEFAGDYAAFFASAKKSLGHTYLRPICRDTLFRFKREMRFHAFSRETISTINKNLDAGQLVIIDRAFRNKTLPGSTVEGQNFYKSLVTAEWLFNTIGCETEIDLTPVVLGYFKAIEQMIFYYLSMVTFEKTGVIRKIKTGKAEGSFLRQDCEHESRSEIGQIKVGYKGLVDVTEDLLCGAFDYLFDMGKLVDFFGYRPWNDPSNIRLFNSDLLESGLNNTTHEYIVDALHSVKKLRNGYLHKENLYSVETVREVREQSLIAIFLVIGSFKFAEEGDTSEKTAQSNYYKLCEFIEESAISFHGAKIPMYYTLVDGEEIGPMFACRDSGLCSYSELGYPEYTGVFFRSTYSKVPDHHYSGDNLPNEIRMVNLDISQEQSGLLKFDLTDPSVVVFKDGIFLM